MNKLIFATGNPGKAREVNALLEPCGIEVQLQSELNIESPPETGTTFVENAIIKARHAASYGHPALADDSGIVVDALHGAPGVYSARYAGVDAKSSANNLKLLEALKDVPEEKRTARFICVLVLMQHQDDPLPKIFQGIWEGKILTQEEGSEGFGYDPLFWCIKHQKSAASLTLDVKNQISHRGLALQQLLTHFKQ